VSDRRRRTKLYPAEKKSCRYPRRKEIEPPTKRVSPYLSPPANFNNRRRIKKRVPFANESIQGENRGAERDGNRDTSDRSISQRGAMAKQLRKIKSNGRAQAVRAKAKNKSNNHFDPAAFLANAGLGRAIVEFQRNQIVFSQGDHADALFYVQRGKIKLSVVSRAGKEATVALVSAGDFWVKGA
jgi:hypothetical protein